MSFRYADCTEVSLQCPIEATTYGYRPILSGNVILLSVFGLATLLQIVLLLRYRIKSFSILVALGTLCECVGYAGRIMMNSNPWDDTGFKMQIVCLILAPSFMAAGLYLTLKHVVLALGPERSRLPPKWYTWIFISCDGLSIVIQAAGGGISSAADQEDMLDVGNNLMVVGVAIQVATMALCVLLALDFAFRLWRSGAYRKGGDGWEKISAYVTWRRGFYWYLTAFSMAFMFIFVRCIYRLPEMAGGWGNELMRNETEFLVLDGGMIAIASIFMIVGHPGIFFPGIRTKAYGSQDVSASAKGSSFTSHSDEAMAVGNRENIGAMA